MVVINISDTRLRRGIVVGLLIAGMACGFAAIGVPKWYVVDHDTVLKTHIGLYRVCATKGLGGAEVCESTRFDAITAGCSRDGNAMLRRVQGLSGTATASPIVAFLALCLQLIRVQPQWSRWLACAFTTMAVLLAAFSVAWSMFLFAGWYYCSTEYCTWARGLGATEACTNGAGISWYLMIACLGCFTVALVVQAMLLVVALRHRAKEHAALERAHERKYEPTAPTVVAQPPNQWTTTFEPKLEPSTIVPKPPPQLPVVSSVVQQRPTAPIAWPDFSRRELNADNILPDGEWIFDAHSQLYWSNDEQLYVHLESGMFYDPHSQMWFDSEVNEWVAAEF